MKIEALILPVRRGHPVEVLGTPAIAESPARLSDSDRRIVKGGGCLYPNPKKLNFDPVPTPPSAQCAGQANSGKSTMSQSQNSGLSDSDRRIVNAGGCLYPNRNKLNFNFVDERPGGNSLGRDASNGDKSTTLKSRNEPRLNDSDRRIIDGGGCLYPNFRLHVDPLPTKRLSKVDAWTVKQSEAEPGKTARRADTTNADSKPSLSEPTTERKQTGNDSRGLSGSANGGDGTQTPAAPVPGSSNNSPSDRMHGDIAPVSGSSLTQFPKSTVPGKPGWLSRSASFLAGEVVGLASAVGSGVVDIAKFLYDVESAVIARGHDLIFERTWNGSYTEVYAPSSSFGTASSEGKGGEAALKIVTEAPDRIRDASIRTGILLEEGKYYEAGKSFGSGPLAEATAALGTVQLATSTPVAGGSFKLTGTGETAPPPPASAQAGVVKATPAVPEPVPVKATAPPMVVLNPFAQIIEAARDFAGGIAGDCEAATQSIRGSITNGMRGVWSYRNAQGPGFHEFVQLPDGTILDATAGQFLAKGQVTAAELAGVEGLNAAIESGVFTPGLHEALRALVAR